MKSGAVQHFGRIQNWTVKNGQISGQLELDIRYFPSTITVQYKLFILYLTVTS